MIDPLTITAGIGFSLSVLSFVSNTLTTLARQRNEFIECRTRLDAYILRLTVYQSDMIAWRYLWYGKHGFADELYIHCWGREGYLEIQSCLKQIGALIASLKAHLKLSDEHEPRSSLSPTDQRLWSDIFETVDLTMRRHKSATRAGLLKRVDFVLGKNDKLQEKLDRLEKLVKSLDTISRRYLRDQQNADPEKKVTDEELRTLDNAFNLEKELSEFASGLFTFHSDLNHVHEWDLELRLPDPDGDAALPDITDIASLNIDFLLRCKCLCERNMASRFRVEYRTRYHSQGNDRPSLAGDFMIDQIRSCSSVPHFHGTFDKPCHSLELLHTLDRPLKMLFGEGETSLITQKAFELDRISIALALVNWVILLYNTPWTSAPCTCKIRRMQLQSSQERYVFVTNLDTHSGRACFGEDLSNRKLVLLGTALAELALATSLTAEKDDEVVFWKNDKRMSRAELLQHLERSRRRMGITEAVRYCLNTSETSGNIRPERLQEYVLKILEPSVSSATKSFYN